MENTELERLIFAVKSGENADEAFAELVRRYEPMMRSRASSMFGGGSDFSEAMQEANIALHSAAITYDKEKCEGVTFGLYASVCVCNRLRSMMRIRLRRSEHTDLMGKKDNLVGAGSPEDFVANRDLCERVLRLARAVLSDFEYQVFKLRFEGYSTKDIAKKLSKTPKSVDNAKCRVSKRLKAVEDIRKIIFGI